jgi:hypothetical protein
MEYSAESRGQFCPTASASQSYQAPLVAYETAAEIAPLLDRVM